MPSLLVSRAVSVCFAMSCWLTMSVVNASPTNAAPPPPAAPFAAATTLQPEEWARFAERFVRPDGRVVDVEKDGVSHSEGQSYGLLLALAAGDRHSFDSILAFTFANMRGRGDALVSWLYDKRQAEPVADRNNASDGDIVIAYALIGAAARWNEPRYTKLARPMIDDIGRRLLHRVDGLVLVRPGAFGFDTSANGDGPVVNLSYFVYGALLAFAAVDNRHPFLEAWQSGLILTQEALAHTGGHAPDWITVRSERRARPAAGFAMKSSYDAVRIPLFMMLGGRVPARYLAPFDRTFNVEGRGAPADIDLATGRTLGEMNDPGYRTIAALTACAARGVPIPARLQRFRPTTYFGSALHLIALSTARAHYPQCVEQAPQIARALPQAAPSPRTWRVSTRRQPGLAGLEFMRASQVRQPRPPQLVSGL